MYSLLVMPDFLRELCDFPQRMRFILQSRSGFYVQYHARVEFAIAIDVYVLGAVAWFFS